jgi:nucleotide-binding universal stress UspA family protein
VAAKPLRSARALLDQAGVPDTAALLIGPITETAARYAKENGCDKVFIGRRGLAGIKGALMGSVTTRLLQLTGLPVTLIK